MKKKSIKNSTTESYTKSAIKAIILLYICLILYVPAITAQSNEGWSASGKSIEKMSIATPGFNYQEEKVPAYILPDPLMLENGTVVSQKDKWTKYRRQEVLELFTTQVFARVPATRYKKTIKVLQTDKNAMNGAATMKLVDIKTMPPLNTPVYNGNGNVAYHIRDGVHNLNSKDWGYFMDYADIIFRNY